MTGTDLLSAMSYVDERFVDQAENKIVVRAIPWGKWISVAACFCIIVAGTFSLRSLFDRGNLESCPAEGAADEQFSQQDAAGAQDEVIMESATESPSFVTIRVETVEGNGFTGTVAEGDIFEPGMLLNVEIDDSYDLAPPIMSDSTARSEWLSPGTLVCVQISYYEETTGFLYVSSIDIVEEPTLD